METLILTLIYICIIAAGAWLILWVLRSIGVPLPERVVQIFWVIVVLCIILLLWRQYGSSLSLGRLPR